MDYATRHNEYVPNLLGEIESAVLISVFVTASYPIYVVLLFRLRFDDFDSFARLVAWVVMVLPSFLFAGLLLARILVVGHEILPFLS